METWQLILIAVVVLATWEPIGTSFKEAYNRREQHQPIELSDWFGYAIAFYVGAMFVVDLIQWLFMAVEVVIMTAVRTVRGLVKVPSIIKSALRSYSRTVREPVETKGPTRRNKKAEADAS